MDVFYGGSEPFEVVWSVETEERDIEEEEGDVVQGEVTRFCEVFPMPEAPRMAT